jgi:hypothetical protein
LEHQARVGGHRPPRDVAATRDGAGAPRRQPAGVQHEATALALQPIPGAGVTRQPFRPVEQCDGRGLERVAHEAPVEAPLLPPVLADENDGKGAELGLEPLDRPSGDDRHPGVGRACEPLEPPHHACGGCGLAARDPERG